MATGAQRDANVVSKVNTGKEYESIEVNEAAVFMATFQDVVCWR